MKWRDMWSLHSGGLCSLLTLRNRVLQTDSSWYTSCWICPGFCYAGPSPRRPFLSSSTCPLQVHGSAQTPSSPRRLPQHSPCSLTPSEKPLASCKLQKHSVVCHIAFRCLSGLGSCAVCPIRPQLSLDSTVSGTFHVCPEQTFPTWGE